MSYFYRQDSCSVWPGFSEIVKLLIQVDIDLKIDVGVELLQQKVYPHLRENLSRNVITNDLSTGVSRCLVVRVVLWDCCRKEGISAHLCSRSFREMCWSLGSRQFTLAALTADGKQVAFALLLRCSWWRKRRGWNIDVSYSWQFFERNCWSLLNRWYFGSKVCDKWLLRN